MTETLLLCKACGSDSIPKGSNFCPNCGTPLQGGPRPTANVPMASAVPVPEENTAGAVAFSAVTDRVTIPVSSVFVDESTSPEAAGTAAEAASPPQRHQQPQPLQQQQYDASALANRATFWKNPTPEMLRHAADSDGMGGILFIIVNARKRGKFTVPKTIHAGHILTGSKLDLTRADFVHSETTIYVGNVLGGFSLVVPRGVRVETQGLGILGAVKGLASQTVHAGQDAPRVVVQGVAILGGIKVSVNTDVPPVQVIE